MHPTRTLPSGVLLGVAAGVAGLAGWGMLVEPRRLDWTEEVGVIPRLPPSWNGRRIALIADLQLGTRFSNAATIQRAVAGLIERRPSLVLIAGDLIQGERPDVRDQAQEAAGLLARLTEVGIPVYTVLGNHDYRVRLRPIYDERVAQQLREALTRAGVRTLENEALALESPVDEQPLYLVGIGPREPRRDDWRAAFVGVPAQAARIVLMHYPETFADLPTDWAPLALAGHTHGGQIRLPVRRREWIPLRLLDPEGFYGDGWASEIGAAGNQLYVNRGLGFSHLPVRIFCPPEVTTFTLTPDDPPGSAA